MSVMIFYEKPGCLSNRKQKALLQSVGVELQVRDMLSHNWNAEELASFFASMPVQQWFNPAAPAVKSGDVDPQQLGPEQALAMLLAEPLLIRRPLLEWKGMRRAGFNLEALRDEWGLPLKTADDDADLSLDQCSRTTAKAGVCP